MSDTPKQRWFRYSLATLFAVVTCVAIVAAWVSNQLSWIRQRQAALPAPNLFSMGMSTGSGGPKIYRPLPKTPGAAGRATKGEPPWTLKLFGESAAPPEIRLHWNSPKEELQRVRALFPESDVRIDAPPAWY